MKDTCILWTMDQNHVAHSRVVCIGSGIAGICFAIQLQKRLHCSDLHIYDRWIFSTTPIVLNNDLLPQKCYSRGCMGCSEIPRSGCAIWKYSTYSKLCLGVACDIPADFYSFSFTPDAEWSRFRPGGNEFEKYLHALVTSHGLLPLMTFETECDGATWIEDSAHWLVKLRNLSSGQQLYHTCDILCVATGQLSVPKVPHIPGLKDFRGPVIHTASWDSRMDLSNKKIAVFGNGGEPVFCPKLFPVFADGC